MILSSGYPWFAVPDRVDYESISRLKGTPKLTAIMPIARRVRQCTRLFDVRGEVAVTCEGVADGRRVLFVSGMGTQLEKVESRW